MDQLNSYYHFNHKGIRRTHRIFTHFFGVSVVNANILYNQTFHEKMLSSVQFFNEVIKSLADLGKDQFYDELETCTTVYGSLEPLVRRPPPVPVVPDVLAPPQVDESKVTSLGFHRYRSTNLEKKTKRLDGIHIPIIVSNSKRRKCVFHPKRKTRYECETWQVPLCLSECVVKTFAGPNFTMRNNGGEISFLRYFLMTLIRAFISKQYNLVVVVV